MQHVYYTLVFVTLFVLGVTTAETSNITLPKTKCDGKEKASTLLDVARDFINKAKYLYPDCIDDDSICGRKEKSLAFLEVASNMITEIKKNLPTCPETVCPEPECPKTECPETECPEPVCPEPECPELDKMPMDCTEIFQSGKNESGVYTIWPKSGNSSGKPLKVYCDMDTDGGGWTVIQRRGNFTTPKDYFYRNWEDYKIGFGNIKEEFWMGNDNIHDISNQANYTIRFDLKDAAGNAGYAEYDKFRIEDESKEYTLRIQGYSGNVGDAMAYHNNAKFSTKDKRNDNSRRTDCAVFNKGAWWYNDCRHANLNGLYQPGVNKVDGVIWTQWTNEVGLSSVDIKLRSQKV